MFAADVPEVEAATVPEDGYLLDVREPDEWHSGHASNAVHIPLGRLSERAGEIPRDREIYVVCRSGGRSAQATEALNKAGWKASNVAGGMQAWAAAGREMTSETGEEPTVA